MSEPTATPAAPVAVAAAAPAAAPAAAAAAAPLAAPHPAGARPGAVAGAPGARAAAPLRPGHHAAAVSGAPLASITRVNGAGMVLIRARLDHSGEAVSRGAGVALPAPNRWTAAGARWLGWMSPDELLMMLPLADVPGVVADLSRALDGHHAMVMDVSDMRCVYDLGGPRPGHVLAKLCPVDLGALPDDGLRRSRAAQIACAFWRNGTGYRIVAFRAVADYLRDVLTLAAAPGTELDPR